MLGIQPAYNAVVKSQPLAQFYIYGDEEFLNRFDLEKIENIHIYANWLKHFVKPS